MQTGSVCMIGCFTIETLALLLQARKLPFLSVILLRVKKVASRSNAVSLASKNSTMNLSNQWKKVGPMEPEMRRETL